MKHGREARERTLLTRALRTAVMRGYAFGSLRDAKDRLPVKKPVLLTVLLSALLIAGAPRPALAQLVSIPVPGPDQATAPPPPPSAPSTPAPRTRGYLTLGGGYQTTQNNFSEGAVKRINAEDGRYDTSYAVSGGPSIEVAAGFTLWKAVGLRVGVGRFSASTDAKVQAAVPHPFFFSKPRGVSGAASGLKREELALSLHVGGLIPVSSRAMITVFAGPTWLQVKQGMVTDFTYTESYPYDTAAFGTTVTSDKSGSAIGFGGGAGLGFFFTKAIGLAVSAQYAQGDVPLSGGGGTTPSVKAGGVKAGFGVVIRY